MMGKDKAIFLDGGGGSDVLVGGAGEDTLGGARAARGLNAPDDQDPSAADRELVSIVVPLYNGASTISETLLSIRRQSWAEIDILVVDDGSTDGSAEIALAHQREDPRVRVLRQPNSGVGVARNSGIEAAKGAYVACIDADDLCHPLKIERQMAKFRDGETVACVYSWYATVGVDDRVQSVAQPSVEGEVLRELCQKNFLGNGSNALMRKSAVLAVGGFPDDPRRAACADLGLYLRLAERYEFRVVKEVLLGYRQTLDSMSNDGLQMIDSLAAVLEPYYRSHPQYIPDIEGAQDGLLDWLLNKALKARRRKAAAVLLRLMWRRQGLAVCKRAGLHVKATAFALAPPVVARLLLSLWNATGGRGAIFPGEPEASFAGPGSASTTLSHVDRRSTFLEPRPL